MALSTIATRFSSSAVTFTSIDLAMQSPRALSHGASPLAGRNPRGAPCDRLDRADGTSAREHRHSRASITPRPALRKMGSFVPARKAPGVHGGFLLESRPAEEGWRFPWVNWRAPAAT